MAASSSAADLKGPSLLTVKGERHMGTNFMQSLLQHFFPHHVRAIPLHGSLYSGCNSSQQPGSVGSYDPNLCCSKHGLPNASCSLGGGAPPVYVLLLRNPYAWLASTHLLPFTGCNVRAKLNFSAWLRRPFAVYGMCRPERLRPTPVAVWSELALEYRSTLARQPAVLLRDDEMLDEGLLGAKLQEMARLLGEPAPRSLALPPSLPGVRRGLRPWTPQTYANEGAKLRQRRWRRLYTEEDLAWVNAQLSEAAMAGLGFGRVRTLGHWRSEARGWRDGPCSAALLACHSCTLLRKQCGVK
eukprot:Transcript_13303.p1 GENE.Transcript_13303~~Transcript_13303.p1  ORF type:complete len:299 (-),score=85.51 Transcript_13303:54-950(-)